MWTVIWTLLAFVLLLFHGDSILAFAAEQLRERRAHRLALERERSRQTRIAHERDALIWRQLDGAAGSCDQGKGNDGATVLHAPRHEAP
jgi:hypothetical protein